MDLKDKVAIVTGGDKPSGKGIAAALGAAGCKLVVTGFEQGPLDALKAEFDGKGYPVAAPALDLTREKEFNRLFNGTITTYGGLNIVVNHFGEYAPTDLISETSQQMIEKFENTLYPVFYSVKWAVEVMMETGGGTIVNVGSGSVYGDFGADAVYAAVQHALRGFTVAGAGELADHNIVMSFVGMATVAGEKAPGKEDYKDFPVISPEELGEAVAETIEKGEREETAPAKLKKGSSLFKGLFK